MMESFFSNAQEGYAIPHRYDKIEKGRSKENRLEVYVYYNRRRITTMNPKEASCDLSRTV